MTLVNLQSQSGPAHKVRVFFRILTAMADRRFVGRNLGGYTLGKVLGQGRFATCFSAEGPQGSVVMKLIKPRGGCLDKQAVWAECKALQACDHPAIPEWLGIVNVDESGATFDQGASSMVKPYFIVEELMSGDSLACWLRKRKYVFKMEEIRAVLLQLVDALEHLEQRGLIHGDLRPANILYDGERVSLIDFGLSQEVSDSRLFSVDRDGLASIALFMLYTDRSRAIPGVKATWREELVLPQRLYQLLEDLFDEAHPWESMSQVRKRIEEAFA